MFDDAVDGLDKRITGKAARAGSGRTACCSSVPGFGDVVGQAWLGEIRTAPHLHFATHQKLASWVTLCPGNNISARKRKHGRARGAERRPPEDLIRAMLAKGDHPAGRYFTGPGTVTKPLRYLAARRSCGRPGPARVSRPGS